MLGALPEAETEYFDELVFVDEDFADRLSVAEKDLIDAYVIGELSGDPLYKFEKHYLASTIRREKVEFASSLQQFSKEKLSVSGAEKAAISEKETVVGSQEKISFFAFLMNPKFAIQIGFAALLILFAGAGVWFLIDRSNSRVEEIVTKTPIPNEDTVPKMSATLTVSPTEEIAPDKEVAETPPSSPEIEVSQTPRQISTPSASPSQTPELPKKTPPKVRLATFVLAPPLRGVGNLKQINLPANTESVAVNLQMESDEFASYQVVLIDQSNNKNLWQSGKIKPQKTGDSGSLNIRFAAKLLRNNTYTLKVTGFGDKGESEVVASYPFRVVIE